MDRPCASAAAGAMMLAAAAGIGQAKAAQDDAAAIQVAAATGDSAAVETVTVTARRRVEAEQSIPAPISVIGGAQLEAKGIYQVQDLQQTLPNVTSQFLHARQSSVAVRGIGNNTANEGLEGSVGLYLDNVFLGRPGQAVFDLLDVEQVDLLRGPQGTLFGKNTTAGVVNITTRLPSFEPEASAEVALGNRGYRQVKGSFSGPAGETSAVRLSVYDTHDDGWLRNLVDARRFDEINRQGARLQWLLKPGKDWSLRLIAEHNAERSSTGTLVPYSFGPLNRGTPGNNLATNATTYAAWVQSKGGLIPTDPYAYRVAIDDTQQAHTHQSALSAELNWTLPGGHLLTSVTAWRDWNFNPKNDLDGTSLPGLTGGFNTREKQYSQELRLASPVGSVWDYVAGAYLYHQKASSFNHYEFGPSAALLSGGANPANNALSGNGEATTRSTALFGQAAWHVNPTVDLSAGLRLTSEEKKAHIQQNGLASPSPFSAFPIYAAWDSGALSRRDHSVAALLNASFRPTAADLVYLTLSRGEKSGGYNVNSVASVGSAFGADAVTIRPEKANNLDLGAKTQWLGGQLQANVNLFVTKVGDYQAVTNRLYPALGTYLGVLTNVGDLTSKGLEFDLKARAARDLTLTLNGAYTIAKFDSGTSLATYETFNDVGNPASPLQGYGKGVQSLTGKWVNGAPGLTANLGANYRQPLSGNVEQIVHVNVAWRSETYGDINNSIYSRIPGYALANLRIGWRSPVGSGHLEAALWATNAFDKRYFLGITSLNNNAYAASAGQPRTVGASLKYEFL